MPDRLASPISLGSFSIAGNKPADGGQLVVYSKGTGATEKRYKAFINERAAIGDVKVADLNYFSNLFDNKDNESMIQWESSGTSSAPTTVQVTSGTEQAQIEVLRKEITAKKKEISEIRPVSEHEPYSTFIQQHKNQALGLTPDRQTPDAFQAVKDILESTLGKIRQLNIEEETRLNIVQQAFQQLSSSFQKANYTEENQTERLVKYAQKLKERNPDVALAILRIIDGKKKPAPIDDILVAVNQKLQETRYPQLQFDTFGTKYLSEKGAFSERSILHQDEKL